MIRSTLSTDQPCLRSGWRLASWIIAVVLSLSCSDSEQKLGPSSQRSQKKVPLTGRVSVPRDNNPIAVPTFPSPQGSDVPRIDCVSLELSLFNFEEGESLAGKVTVRNDCNMEVSVLTAPLETRVRKERTDFFVNETLVEPLYARLYVSRVGLGPQEEAFLGDGGLEVSAWPSHLHVSPHAKRGVRIAGTVGAISQLSAGEYEAVLVTLVAPSLGGDGGVPYFDLEEDVGRYNPRFSSGSRLTLRPSATEISSGPASFRVLRASKARPGGRG